MEKKTLGTFLAALRKANGMTQKDLADRLNVSDKAVSRWERDENCPDLTLIPVIADIFGVTSDELLRGERIAADSPRSSEKSDRQIRYLVDNLVFRYLVGAVIAVAAVVGGFVLCRCVTVNFNNSYGEYDARISHSERIWTAITTTVMWSLWIGAVLYVVLRYLASRRQLASTEGTEIEADGKKRIHRIFRIAIIFLTSFVFMMAAATETGSDFDMFFFLFLVTLAGLGIGIPLLRRVFGEFRSHHVIARPARRRFFVRTTAITVLFVILWGVVFWLGEATDGTFFGPGKWFFNEESFCDYMETVTEDSEQSYSKTYSILGEPVIFERYEWEYESEDGRLLVQPIWDEHTGGSLSPGEMYRFGANYVTFVFQNEKVSTVLFADTDNMFPIRTFTEAGENIGFAIWIILLIGIPVLCFLALRRERIRASQYSEAIEEESLLQPKNAKENIGEASSAEAGEPDEEENGNLS